MKKLCTVLAIAFFSVSISAQEAKPAAKKETKKEACCSSKEAKKTASTSDEKSKGTADAKAKDDKAGKSCCSKKA
jgi:hypothetical protein